MAYMCADIGNLMAIAQQVIQQQQHQRHHHHHLPPPPMPLPLLLPPRQMPPVPAPMHGQIPAASPPYGSGTWPQADHFFPNAFVGTSAADAVFPDLTAATDFDSEVWMDSLIGDAPVFADSDLERLIFTTPPPPPVPATPAVAPVDTAAQPKAATPAPLPQPAAVAAQAACSSPSSLDASCSAPILQSLLTAASGDVGRVPTSGDL